MGNTNSLENTTAQAQKTSESIGVLISAMGGLVEEVEKIKIAFSESTESFEGFKKSINVISESFMNMKSQTNVIRETLKDFFKQLEASEGIKAFKANVIEIVANLGEMMQGKDVEWTLFKKIEENAANAITAFDNFRDNLDKRIEKMQNPFSALKEKLSGFSFDDFGKSLTTNASDIGSKVGTLLSGGIVAGIAVAAAAVAGLVAAFQYLMESNSDFRDGVTKAWEGVIEAFQPAIDAFNTLKETIFGTQGASSEFTNGLLAGIVLILDGVAAAVGILSELVAGILGVLTDLWVKHGDTIGTGMQETFDKIREIVTGLSTTVKKVLETISGLFKGDKLKIKKNAQDMWKGIRKVFSNAWKEIKNIFNGVGDFFEGVWKTIKKKFTSIGSSIGSSMGKAFKNVVNSVVDFAEITINKFIGSINGAIGLINKIPGVSISALPALSIPRMAEGGMVSAGQLFIARERGPELVGSFNGASGVMNNSQIVQAVSAGVYEAVKAAMGGGGEYTFNITNTLDGREIGKQVVKYHNGVVRQTGRTPLTI